MSKGHAGSSSSWERCCSSSFPRSRTPPEGTRSPAIRHRPTTPTRVAGCCWPTAPAGSTWAADRRRAHRPPRHLHVESKSQPVPLRLRHRRRRPVPVARALAYHLRVRRLPDSPLPERLEPLFAVAAALARGPQRRQHRQPLQLPRQLAGDLWHADEDEAQGRPLLQPRLEWDQPHPAGRPATAERLSAPARGSGTATPRETARSRRCTHLATAGASWWPRRCRMCPGGGVVRRARAGLPARALAEAG